MDLLWTCYRVVMDLLPAFVRGLYVEIIKGTNGNLDLQGICLI